MTRDKELITKLFNLLASIVDEDACYFDHHCSFQAHGYISLEQGEKCPQFEAKGLLKEYGYDIG